MTHMDEVENDKIQYSNKSATRIPKALLVRLSGLTQIKCDLRERFSHHFTAFRLVSDLLLHT